VERSSSVLKKVWETSCKEKNIKKCSKKFGNKKSLTEYAICVISVTFNRVLFYTPKSLPQYYYSSSNFNRELERQRFRGVESNNVKCNANHAYRTFS